MKKLFFSITFFISFQANAQTPTKVWDSTIGSSGTDVLSSIVATNDGGFVLAGYSGSGISGDKTEASKGVFDYWIVRLNSLGQKVWDRTIGGSGIDYATSVVATIDGGFVVAGYSYSGISGDKTEANKESGSYTDYWIVKLNSAGQKVWDKTIGGNFYDEKPLILATIDGGFIIAGQSLSGYSGDKTSGNNGYYGYWIVKLNSLGQKVWDTSFDGYDRDSRVRTITATLDGGFVVAGIIAAGGINTDYRIAKFNNSGGVVWYKTIGSLKTDRANSVIATSDGGFLIAGESFSGISGDKTETGIGAGFNPWLVKLNSLGEKVWDKSISTLEFSSIYSVVSTNDGGFVLAGLASSSYGISGDKSESGKGGDDYWIVKINSLGQKVWDKTIGGSSADRVGDSLPGPTGGILKTNDGSFIIAGYSYSGISGDKTQASKGDTDYWIIKITDGSSDCPNTLTPTGTIISNQKAINTVITIAGNASNGTLNIIPNSANVTYQGGQYVLLNPGFVANQSSVFIAKILAGCN
ncbi:3-coathanger stack domain-containing protein [Emticicia sp. SJ17W-69]|uniref:3-coathanger stack domain-containing protein n=1 Tax=Emticicia sp. SJ17W-69 TaxID=3421657 RepID=UPI003EC04D5A